MNVSIRIYYNHTHVLIIVFTLSLLFLSIGYYLLSQESNTIYRIPNIVSAQNLSNKYAYYLLAADIIATFTFIFSGVMIVYLSTRFKTRKLAGKQYVRVKQKDDDYEE